MNEDKILKALNSMLRMTARSSGQVKKVQAVWEELRKSSRKVSSNYLQFRHKIEDLGLDVEEWDDKAMEVIGRTPYVALDFLTYVPRLLEQNPELFEAWLYNLRQMPLKISKKRKDEFLTKFPGYAEIFGKHGFEKNLNSLYRFIGVLDNPDLERYLDIGLNFTLNLQKLKLEESQREALNKVLSNVKNSSGLDSVDSPAIKMMSSQYLLFSRSNKGEKFLDILDQVLAEGNVESWIRMIEETLGEQRKHVSQTDIDERLEGLLDKRIIYAVEYSEVLLVLGSLITDLLGILPENFLLSGAGLSARTTGKQIVLPHYVSIVDHARPSSRYNRLEDIKQNPNATVFAGTSSHESAHIRYGSLVIDWSSYLSNNFDNPTFAKEILNIIEDARVEHHLRADKGGDYKKLIDIKNKCYVRRFSNTSEDFPFFMEQYLWRTKAGFTNAKFDENYKKAEKKFLSGKISSDELIAEGIKTYEDLLLKVVELSLEAKTGDIDDSVKATEEVYQLITKEFSDPSSPLNQSYEQFNQHMQQKGAGGEGGMGEDDPEKMNLGDNEIDFLNPESYAPGARQPGQESPGKEGRGKGGVISISNKDELERLGAEIKKELEAHYQTNEVDKDAVKGKGKTGGGKPGGRGAGGKRGVSRTVRGEPGLEEGFIMLPDEETGYYIHRMDYVLDKRLKSDPSYSQRVPKRIVKEVEQELKRMDENRFEKERSRRIGKLSKKGIKKVIANTIAGKKTKESVFERYRQRERDYAIGILVDSSGSTQNYATQDKRIIDVECEAAYVLGSAATYLGDQTGIYTFTSGDDNPLKIDQVKSFKERWRRAYGRLASVEPTSGTPLHGGIRYMMEDFKNVDAEAKILFVLSDGDPNDMNSALSSIDDAKREGIQVVYLNVNSSKTNNYETIEKHLGKKYSKWFSKAEELPKKIFGLYQNFRT